MITELKVAVLNLRLGFIQYSIALYSQRYVNIAEDAMKEQTGLGYNPAAAICGIPDDVSPDKLRRQAQLN